ncbi:hypothetical protein BDV93DRAFT_467878 [Ceratobasidium sp. AG-I]|nr:hypothetical protein BDV93DRAFT_467878 [Ceratobasidium sp. AG-I]
MYRLLDLWRETGSGGLGGLVEKVIIDQYSLGLLLNKLMPGSYESVSRINFKALDELTIKPKGVYGSKSEIAKFLQSIHCIDEKTTSLLSKPSDQSSSLTLHSGIYLALPPNEKAQGERSHEVYLIYWPGDTTWDDNANLDVQRNRVTFMRYLTQLSDQIIALVSAEQAKSFVWDSSIRNSEIQRARDDDDDDDNGDMRMFSFEVSKSEEQEENVTASESFQVLPVDTHSVNGLQAEIPPKLASKDYVLVGGDTMAGLLVLSVEESRTSKKSLHENYTIPRLKRLINNPHQSIVLGDQLVYEQLRILRENGLRDRYPAPFREYRQQVDQAQRKHDQDLEESRKNLLHSLEGEKPEIERRIREIAKAKVQDFQQYAYLRLLFSFLISASKPKTTHIRDGNFQALKSAVRIIRDQFDSRQMNDAEQKAVIDNVSQDLRMSSRHGLQADTNNPSLVDQIYSIVFGDSAGKEPSSRTNDPTDLEFVSSLNSLVSAYPTLLGLSQRIIGFLQDELFYKENEFVNHNMGKAIDSEFQTRSAPLKKRIQDAHDSRVSHLRSKLFDDLRAAMRTIQTFTVGCILSISSDECIMGTTHVVQTPRQTIHQFYPLELTQEAIRECQNNDAYIPRPVLARTPHFEFKLEEGHSVEFMHLVGHKCLVIVASAEQSQIFMNDYPDIYRAIEAKAGKFTLHHGRLGGKPMYAFDEGTRVLALLHGQADLKVTHYAFDKAFSSARNRGTLALHGWYEAPVDIQSISFVAGSEELCLIDSLGHARILSLVTENFRPASLQLGHLIEDSYSTPDGSCLLTMTRNPGNKTIDLFAYHWTSFGSSARCFNPTQLAPGTTSHRVTSFESRSRVYVLSICATKPTTIFFDVLRITRKSTEFAFKSKAAVSTAPDALTVNNCLVDCYMDMWTRFPVLPAVARTTLAASVRKPQSITFVSSEDFSGAKAYFAKMISTFERTTRKPTDGRLSAIEIKWAPHALNAFVTGIKCSYFHFGSFIVELLCLIPIHLAVTRENRFIPLKDGVLNSAYERRLLGADVPTIINSLSIGWYESLFQSYMATKPVRVVSSMGEYVIIVEPSIIGKSYCLNHFADTSFAGSAMRTTEGVWLSCTPTKEYLLVSLDFEGVHSIERSAQEDALLVLFNAALSNIVLFRNNFAISRDIANLFSSFQSSAMVLDPQLNPGLFNSDLAIIIKDVIKADSQDIVREFSQKFQSIVREEQDQNFITRLHRGQVHIMPWPVITSPGFYTLFRSVRDNILDKQPITHVNAGIFLHTLKTLMAKIKANDWGALDQNLAAHRAQQLAERLPVAISRGGMDQDHDMWGSMKSPISDDVFWVSSTTEESSGSPEVAIESSLEALINAHKPALGARHAIQESIYFNTLQGQIYAQLDQRIGQVRQWIDVNISRFPSENQDIRDLVKSFEAVALSTRAAVKMCSSTCDSCHLSCLRPYRHEGEHDCKTTHNCALVCEVSDMHSELTPCGLRSGHSGRHLCEGGNHTCGQVCSLEDRNGCTRSCAKAIDHQEDHLCSARLHFCGKPCDLQNAQQFGQGFTYSCPGVCQMPWDEPHKRHACTTSNACPIECQLCRRLCCSNDHFHGLDPDSVHLCGQSHSCTMLCEAPGVCLIETQPSAVLERFTGHYETFEYTQYSQEKRRLSCVVVVQPGQTAHQGPHTHSTAEVVFHFCDVQCPRCKYYCTLPLGHPQQQHETSHGSMIETRWLVEGSDANPSYELQGRKFGPGDQGAPMLCSLVCSQQGRHAHVDYCRDAQGCGGVDHKHMDERILPHPDIPKDWISHGLYWARSGAFESDWTYPYSRDEQIDFAKCDAYCAGIEHEATATTATAMSYCDQPIFHLPLAQRPVRRGYISRDGHSFSCSNPVQPYQSFHFVFVIDSSSSMTYNDHKPLSNIPISSRLRSSCNNRYGAVLSALYGFCQSRQALATSPRGIRRTRTDAYSVITFADTATTRVSNDLSSTTDEIIGQLIPQQRVVGTKFAVALSQARALIEANWDTDRAPVVIFLSDGEARIEDDPIASICQLCVQLGKPLAFYTISFGSDRGSRSLRRMADVAHRVYAAARQGSRTASGKVPCSYANAIDSIELATTFADISDSLQKPRASLIGSFSNR